MEMEVDVSLVGDGGCSRVILVSCSTQGKKWKRYKEPMLGLVRKFEKEDEEEEEEGVDLRRK
jgi:hypothetical protein